MTTLGPVVSAILGYFRRVSDLEKQAYKREVMMAYTANLDRYSPFNINTVDDDNNIDSEVEIEQLVKG